MYKSSSSASLEAMWGCSSRSVGKAVVVSELPLLVIGTFSKEADEEDAGSNDRLLLSSAERRREWTLPRSEEEVGPATSLEAGILLLPRLFEGVSEEEEAKRDCDTLLESRAAMLDIDRSFATSSLFFYSFSSSFRFRFFSFSSCFFSSTGSFDV